MCLLKGHGVFLLVIARHARFPPSRENPRPGRELDKVRNWELGLTARRSLVRVRRTSNACALSVTEGAYQAAMGIGWVESRYVVGGMIQAILIRFGRVAADAGGQMRRTIRRNE